MTVFYDPSAGFVTGGGYILQTAAMNPPGPVGAKSNYGFNAKYKQNSSTLQGEIEFQYKPNLNFHSTTLDWLSSRNEYSPVAQAAGPFSY